MTILPTILQVLFWLSLALIAWTYFGYPVFLLIVSRFRRTLIERSDQLPNVTMIVTAYNEVKRIRNKIENSLEVDYPAEKIEIIVVSDGSTDGTDDIVREYVDRGVRLIRVPERQGKHYGQRMGIEASNHDILIFSDATTFLARDAAQKISTYFGDETIGCVSGNDRVRTQGDAPGESFYVRYEMKLRELESQVGSLVGVSGCFFAVRKEMCMEWIDDMSSDFYLPVMTYMAGSRSVLAEDSIGYYEVLHNPSKEFARKVRTVVHGLEVFFRFAGVMNIFKYGFFSIQLFSHKLARWLVPFCLVIAMALNIALYQYGVLYQVMLAAQVIFYLFAAAAFHIPGLHNLKVFRIPMFFVVVNGSIAVAWYYYVRGKDFVLWEPTKR